MNVCSIPFLISCGLSSVIFNLLPHGKARRLFLSAINLAFLALYVPNRRSWICLIFAIVASYLAIRWVKARPSRTSVLAVVSLSVVIFAYLKQYSILDAVLPHRLMPTSVELIGLSYMLFKFIHVLVDSSQGQLAPFTFATYANYQLSFFTLVAGPIQRFDDFRKGWEGSDLDLMGADDVLASWGRMLTGVIKVGAIAPIAWSYFADGRQVLSGTEVGTFGRLAGCFYAYPIYMYFNFSGYTDIVIGAAGLFGFRLPENFNRPYLARNVIDFWNRWHITLSHWIRDYIFMPSYKSGLERFPSWARPIGYSMLFLSLLIAGIWHGSTANFAVFGAIHGLGAAANQASADWLKGRLGREWMKRYQKSRAIHWAAMVLTFHYVSFSFLFFSLGLGGAIDAIRAFGRRLLATGLPGFAPRFDGPTVLGISLLAILLLFTWYRDAILEGLDRFGSRIASGTGGLYRAVLIKAAIVAILLLSLWATEQDPVVVYGRF